MSHTIHPARVNPFPTGDADRHAIWQALVERDVLAFLGGDWEMAAPDFLEDGFVGHAGPSNPDHWRIDYPSLETYRQSWLEQAAAFRSVSLEGIDKADFLFSAQTLRDIEIRGDHALAHKKFNGSAKTISGKEIILRWQTLYRLRRVDGHWKVSGFLGYLPNPAGCAETNETTSAATISLPISASQHETAGPYSPVLRVRSQKLVVLSGQGPINEEGRILGSTIEEQTRLTLENCMRHLKVAGVAAADVFKVNVYLSDMTEWARFNQVYQEFFREPYPARTAIQAGLWEGIKVEIEMTAIER